MENSSGMSWKSRKSLKAQSRELLINVHRYFSEERNRKGPMIPLSRVNERVAAALKVNKNTVTRVLKEKYGIRGDENNVLKTPKKTFVRVKAITEMDVFRSDAIRRHVYNYFLRYEKPTVRRMVMSLNEAGLFEGSDTSLRNFLKNIGFHYKKRLIMERTDVALWRCMFLRRLKDMTWDSLVFTGEAWIGDTVASAAGAPDSAVTLPVAKSERLVLCHAGTVAGFVPNALLAYVAPRASDKHEEMSAQTYQRWFVTQLMPNIPRNSTIMINDTPYHSVEADRPPSAASTKAEVIAWLTKNDIPCSEDMRKPELMHLVKLSKTSSPTYVIDQIAHMNGHRVIRVPPNHCIYNPIELIWAQAKSYMVENVQDEVEERSDALALAKLSLRYIMPADWRAFVENTKQKVEEDWETYGLLERRMEELLCNMQDCSDSTDSESDEEDL